MAAAASGERERVAQRKEATTEWCYCPVNRGILEREFFGTRTEPTSRGNCWVAIEGCLERSEDRVKRDRKSVV